jgi:acyl transferase domain-containing protein
MAAAAAQFAGIFPAWHAHRRDETRDVIAQKEKTPARRRWEFSQIVSESAGTDFTRCS